MTDGVNFDLYRRTITGPTGRQRSLSLQQCCALSLLLAHASEVVTTEAFFAAISRGRVTQRARLVHAVVCQLRKKLGDVGAQLVIRTDHGRGYALFCTAPLVRPDASETIAA